jgi:hypothetical protein
MPNQKDLDKLHLQTIDELRPIVKKLQAKEVSAKLMRLFAEYFKEVYEFAQPKNIMPLIMPIRFRRL